MKRAKVIYLEEYRKARQYKNLLEMIEGHLAEAGLLDVCTTACCGNLKVGNQPLQQCEADKGGEKPE